MAEQARGALDEVASRLRAVLQGEDTAEVDVPVEAAGVRRWYAVRLMAQQGRRGGAVMVHRDVTERKRSEAELEMKARRDPLTGVLNRLAFEEEVDLAVARAQPRGAPVAVLFIDLDGFKPINDAHGHAVGDDVLRAVAQRITGAIRTGDRVARLGGDEFVVLVDPLDRPSDAEKTADRILEALSVPVPRGDLRIPISASIGVGVVAAPGGGSSRALIERADRAMYRSKRQGGGRVSPAV